MAEPRRATAAASVAAASLVLAWVAFYNGYPLVFADTGTYLGQALQRYLGWDRPVFYSFLLLALHWGLTLWAVPLVQAALIAHLVWLVLRTLGGGVLCYAAVIALLAVGTAAPWFAAWLIPDVFTGAVVLVLWLLGAVPERLSITERLYLVGLGTVSIVVHQSHVPLAAGLVIVLLVGRWVFGLAPRLGWRGIALLLAPLVAAMLGMMLVNLIGHGRFSLSPFGANFMLARVIYDGPGAATLVEACPERGWRLCAYLAELPPASLRYPSSDHFLWQPDSPFYRLGHPRETAPEAAEIVAETLRRHGLWQLRRAAENTLTQLRQFRTGVGTDFGPWLGAPGPEAVIAEFITGDLSAFRSARQARSELTLLAPMRRLHSAVVMLSLPAVLVAAIVAWRRGERAGTLLVAAILAAILGNAILAGGLSAVHDRYTARLAWLMPAAALALLLARRRGQASDQPSRA